MLLGQARGEAGEVVEEGGRVVEQGLELGLDEGFDVVRRDAGRRPGPALVAEVGLAGGVAVAPAVLDGSIGIRARGAE